MFFTKWLMDTIQLFRNKLTNNWKIKSEVIYEKHAEGTQNLTGQKTDTYSQPCQTSKTECFAKIIKKKTKTKTKQFSENHSVHWGLNPPLKHSPSFLPSPPPLKSANSPSSSPFFRHFLPCILVFRQPPLKSRIFQWTPKILKFFILNTILSSKSN